MIVTATGWSYREIDELEIWQLKELLGYWRGHAPVHILLEEANAMIAAIGGVKRASRSGAPKGHKPSKAELQQLVQSFNGGRR